MLNELHAIERGLAAHGVTTVPRHPDIKETGKGDVIRVRLDPTGAIAELELLSGKDRPALWTLRDGQQNGFPGLKTGFRNKGQAVATGLLDLRDAERDEHDRLWLAAKTPAAKRAELLRLTTAVTLDARASQWPKYRNRLAERLEQLRRLAEDPRTVAVPATFERFLKALDAHSSFLEALLAGLVRKVSEGDEDWLEPAHAAFCGEVAIYLDVALSPSIRRDAGDARQIAAISAVLQGGAATSGRESNPVAPCALTGASTELLNGNYPQPNLPGLGQTYLFARNRDIPAMARYGRNGAASFPVDADLASRLCGAVLAVTEEQRRDKTWRLQAAETGDRLDLLIAYVAAELDAPLAGALAAEGDVEAGAESVLDLFDGVAKAAKPRDDVRILLMRTVDPANRKAIYDKQTTVEQVHLSALTWRAAMLNAPDWLRWPVFVDRKQVLGGPSALPPLSLTALSRRMYIRGGRESTDAPGATSAEALALFLNEGDQLRRAGRLLRLLLDRHTGLVSGLAQASTRGQLKDFDKTATGRRDGLRSIAWMGALLYFLDRPKETYMDDTGFKLGQLLSAVDKVHMGYCADVRGGDTPPTLIGNSVFATAGRDPLRALGVLQTRWKPYAAWARRTDAVLERANAKPDNLAWAMRRGISQARIAGRLCEGLQDSLRDRSEPCDDSFRAELLLGYVAGVRPDSNPPGPDTDTSAEGAEETTA